MTSCPSTSNFAPKRILAGTQGISFVFWKSADNVIMFSFVEGMKLALECQAERTVASFMMRMIRERPKYG
jgi:hypothetical protein